jgi:hypothetical protein
MTENRLSTFDLSQVCSRKPVSEPYSNSLTTLSEFRICDEWKLETRRMQTPGEKHAVTATPAEYGSIGKQAKLGERSAPQRIILVVCCLSRLKTSNPQRDAVFIALSGGRLRQEGSAMTQNRNALACSSKVLTAIKVILVSIAHARLACRRVGSKSVSSGEAPKSVHQACADVAGEPALNCRYYQILSTRGLR